MKAQFARIESFSVTQLTRLVGEADRERAFSSHLASPGQPRWATGSPDVLKQAVAEFMQTPCPVKQKNGSMAYRRRRADFRGVVAGVMSWPDSFDEMRQMAFRDEMLRVRDWMDDCRKWLRKQFDDRLKAMVIHVDESHPHLHFFVVGDANRLHPGLRAEFENGERLASMKLKRERHAQALNNWLDDFHSEVSSRFGHLRTVRNVPKPRIKDRAVALRLLELERSGAPRELLAQVERLQRATDLARRG